jgi:antitoxin Phd
MTEITATDAKNRFGQVLEMAMSEPVRVQKAGRDVAVIVSAEEYRRLKALDARGPNPKVMEAHARSVKRFGKVYEALAK